MAPRVSPQHRPRSHRLHPPLPPLLLPPRRLPLQVTPPALLSLSTEILSERGPIPVGEVGKLLQEATSNGSLSSTLKERFGGLKRFLEAYPQVFV